MQRADKQHGQQEIARQPVKRIKKRQVPCGCCCQHHFSAIPDRAESACAQCRRQADRARHDGRGNHRQHTSGKRFRQEIGQKTRTPQPRPAHLPVPDFGGAAPAQRLHERPIDQPYLET